MKLVRLIKMCLNETYSKVRIGKHLSDNFPFQNDLKQGPGRPGGTEIKWDTSAADLCWWCEYTDI
jgi:hypothetical protein